MKSGRVDIGCARWLQYKQIDLDLAGGSYMELADQIEKPSDRPRHHIAVSLSVDQEAAMTKFVLEQWIQIRSDQAFTRSLLATIQST
jgi:hypothetical protein